MCLLDLVLLQTDSQNNCISLVLFHIPSMLALQCDGSQPAPAGHDSYMEYQDKPEGSQVITRIGK